MTKKKHPSAGSTAASKPAARSAPAKAPSKKPWWIAVGVAAVIVIGLVVATTGGGAKQGTGSASTPGSAAAAGASPEEAKYLGRLLPAGYVEPKVADVAIYDGVTPMTDLKADQTATQLSIPVAKLTESKLVYFEYAKSGSKPIPMIAYVKPSGSAFVGVSYCPPCEGERQRVEADLTLTCASCGTKRNIETGVGISGACKLYPLDEIPAKLVGGNIVIDNAALDSWTPQPKDRKIG